MSIQFVEGQFVDSYDPTIENSKYISNYLSCYAKINFDLKVTILFYFIKQKIMFVCFTAFVKTTKVNNQEYELKLVDTAGQDEYSILPTQYSMDIHGYVLVYSITSPKSFEIIQIIYDKLLDMTGKVQ